MYRSSNMSSRIKPEFLLILLYIQAVDGQNVFSGSCSPNMYCALRGSTVKMECTFTYPDTPPQTVLETLWFPGDQSNNVGLEMMPEYKGRVEHHCSGNRCTMKISDVTQDDAKEYMFRFITTEDKYTVGSGIKLSVTDLQVHVEGVPDDISNLTIVSLMCRNSCKLPSQQLYVWFFNGYKVNWKEQSYKAHVLPGDYIKCGFEGQDLHTSAPLYFPSRPSVVQSPPGEVIQGHPVNLMCIFGSGVGLNYTWYKKTNISQQISEGKDLLFSVVESSDSGEYYCSVETMIGTIKVKTKSKPVIIDVQYAPILLSVSVNSNKVMEGASISLTCSSDANPQAYYTWFMKGVTTAVATGKIFTIHGIRCDQAGSYVCRAQNLRGHSEAVMQLNVVSENPTGPLVVQSPPGDVIEGHQVKLTCSFCPGFKLNYTWYKSSALSQQMFVDKDLHFSPVLSSDSGEYSCSVDEMFWRKSSESVIIDVQYAPRPPSVSVSSDEVMEGASVNLTCSSDANPQANYTWYIEADMTTVATGEIFNITNVKLEQAGSYVCRAQNLRGHSEAVVQLNVVSGSMKIPFISITGLLFLLLLFTGVHIFGRLKFFKPSPEPAGRAEYHAKRKSTRECNDVVEEDDHVYTSNSS